MARPSRFSPEVHERAVRMVLEQTEAHGSRWGAVRAIASKIGCSPETLRKWIERDERDRGRKHGPTTQERTRIQQLEREVHELKRANEVLRKASAYFAQAELDRRQK